MDINNIVSTTIQTVEKLKEYTNWWNALFLYFDYIKHSRIQHTNQVWCNDEFMMKSIWFGVDKFRNAKNLLKKIWLIEVIQSRWDDWKLWKYYIKINFLIWEEKRQKSIKPETGENQASVKPETGVSEVNALNNKIKILEKENKILKENFNKLKEQSSTEIKIYWKIDINEMQELIKNKVLSLWLIYKSWSQERNRIQNILTWKDFGEICERANMSREDFVLNIIELSTKLDFWKWKIYNSETLYKHYASVYNEAVRIKSERKKPMWC